MLKLKLNEFESVTGKMKRQKMGVVVSNPGQTLFTIIIAFSLTKCISAELGDDDSLNGNSTDYIIRYNVSQDTLRIQPFESSYPTTLFLLSEKMFIYKNGNGCFLGKLTSASLRRLKGLKQQKTSKINQFLRGIFGPSKTFYATKQLGKSQVPKQLLPVLLNECGMKRVWMLQRAKPKLQTFEEFRKDYERNRTSQLLATKTNRKNKERERRSINYFTLRRTSQSKRRNPRKQNLNIQADESSSSSVTIANDVAYMSPSFNRQQNATSGFRHYGDFHNELEVENSNGATGHHKKSLGIGSRVRSNDQHVTESVEKENFKFPDTIYKDGKVFYRHDTSDRKHISEADDEENFNMQNTSGAVPDEVPLQESSFGLNGDHQDMPRGFDILMDHVRQVGAQRPIISAAIAGASIRGSSQGSTSHVVGSAINGGYFAASAQGYDGKGGKIHSHIHGTSQGVSGGASAIAPDRDGEAFIQVDHSERGLSIGQSSTHNGEAFVVADVDNKSDFQQQHGDSTSSFADHYNSKRFGHSFGEAKSHISSPNNKHGARDVTTFINASPDNVHEHRDTAFFNASPDDRPDPRDAGIFNGDNSFSKIKSSQEQRSVGIEMLDSIMEKVHHPTIVPDQNRNKYVDENISNKKIPPQYVIEDLSLEFLKPRSPEINIQETFDLDLNRGNKLTEENDKDGVVGVVTFPYGQAGTPPGPGELLNQNGVSDTLPSTDIISKDETFFNQYPFDTNLFPTNDGSIYDTKRYNLTPKSNQESTIDGNLQNNFDLYSPQYLPAVTNGKNSHDQKIYYSSDVSKDERKRLPQFETSHPSNEQNIHVDQSYLLGAYQPHEDTHFPEKSFRHDFYNAQNSYTTQSPLDYDGYKTKSNFAYTKPQSEEDRFHFVNVPLPPNGVNNNDHYYNIFNEGSFGDEQFNQRNESFLPTKTHSLADNNLEADRYNSSYSRESNPSFHDYHYNVNNENPVLSSNSSDSFILPTITTRSYITTPLPKNTDLNHFYTDSTDNSDYYIFPQYSSGIPDDSITYPNFSEAPQPFTPNPVYSLLTTIPPQYFTTRSYDWDYDQYNPNASYYQPSQFHGTRDIQYSNNGYQPYTPELINPGVGENSYDVFETKPRTDSDYQEHYTTQSSYTSPSPHYYVPDTTEPANVYLPNDSQSTQRRQYITTPAPYLPSVDKFTRDRNGFQLHTTRPAYSGLKTTEKNSFYTPTEETRKPLKVITPGKVGSTRRLELAGPGELYINVVTVDINDRTNTQKGIPIREGGRIPGIPGYRIPSGFRGRVIYGPILPLGIPSKPTNYKLNTNSRGQTHNRAEHYASSHFRDPPHYYGIKSQRRPADYRQTSRTYSRSSQSRQSPWNERRQTEQYANSRKSSNSGWADRKGRRQSEERCGYYSDNCENMFGPYQSSKLCIPQFIVVDCCC